MKYIKNVSKSDIFPGQMLSIVMWLVTFVTFQEDLKCHNIINLLIPALYKPIKLAQKFLYDWFQDKRFVTLQEYKHCISHFKSLTPNILRLFKIQLDFFLFCFQVWSGYNRNILENLTIDWLLRVTCAGVVTMGRSLTMEGGDRRGQRTVGVATSALQQGVIMQQSHSWSKQPCK